MLKSPPTQNRVDFTLPLFYLLPTTKREDTQSFLTQKREFVTIKKGELSHPHKNIFICGRVLICGRVHPILSPGTYYFIFGRVHPILSPVTYYFIFGRVHPILSPGTYYFIFVPPRWSFVFFLLSLLTLAPLSGAINIEGVKRKVKPSTTVLECSRKNPGLTRGG